MGKLSKEVSIGWKNVIESNRQIGSTTAICESWKKTGGYILVGNMEQARSIHEIHKVPLFNICTVRQLNTAMREKKRGVLYIDTTFVIEFEDIMRNKE